MELITRSAAKISILEVTERFDVLTAQYLNDWLAKNVSANANRLIIDLATVKFIDSSGLAALVKGRHLCRQQQGDLYLCNLQDFVRITFKETCLDKIFHIFESESEAVSQFGIASA